MRESSYWNVLKDMNSSRATFRDRAIFILNLFLFLQAPLAFPIGSLHSFSLLPLGELSSIEENHLCLRQFQAVGLSSVFLSRIFDIRSFSSHVQFSKTIGNSSSFSLILLMVSLWYCDSNGVFRVINLKRRTPADHTSTPSRQPPENISGARQYNVPVIVHISIDYPLLLNRLDIPKSMSLIFFVMGSQRILSGLMSRCTISFLWRQFRDSSNWNITFFMSSSQFRSTFSKEGASISSITSQANLFLISIYKAWYLMMLGCLNLFNIRKLALSPGRCSSSKVKDLTAYSSPDSFFLHLFTTPLVPSPSFSKVSYFSQKIQKFPMEAFYLPCSNEASRSILASGCSSKLFLEVEINVNLRVLVRFYLQMGVF